MSRKTITLIGQKFGKLVVIGVAKDKNNNIKKTKDGHIKQKCLCECGKISEIRTTDLKNGHTKSCGRCTEILSGQKFGKLIVIGPAKDKNGNIKKSKNRHIKQECLCECGKTSEVFSVNLKNGYTKSCGRCNEILPRQKFGKLVVIKVIKDKNGNIKKSKGGYTRWECLCECGKTSEALSANLKSGHTKSCGRCVEILSGQKFGKLVVIGIAKNKNGNIKWECLCECGKTSEIYAGSLRSGQTKSCGCLACSKYISQNILINIIKEIFPNVNIESNYRKLNWLQNPKTKYKLEIDIYIPKLKLAIEYDGKQHFEPVNFGGISDEDAIKNFKKVKKLDKIKNRLIKNHIKYSKENVKYFIRFNYRDKLTKENIKNKLQKYGIIK